MVYLDNIHTAQTIFIPCHGVKRTGNLTFVATNTVDHSSFTLTTTDTGNSLIYYIVNVTLPTGCECGEYEFKLMSGTTVVSTGIMIVNDGRAVTEYNKTIVYEQYNN